MHTHNIALFALAFALTAHIFDVKAASHIATHQFDSPISDQFSHTLRDKTAAAQPESGPVVPCDGCEGQQLFEAPSSGPWSNPEAPGTTLNIVMQNGLLIGTYFGRNSDGTPQWYLFHGMLQRPEDAPHLLRLTASLERYESGACLGCTYRPPRKFLDAGQIVLEFDQRNHGTYAIGSGARNHIVPQVFGVPVSKEFSSVMHYELPDLTGAWLLTFRVHDSGWLEELGVRAGSFTGKFEAKVTNHDGRGEPYSVQWLFSALANNTGDAFYPARVVCERLGSPPAAAPSCSFDIAVSWSTFPELQNMSFPLPYANIGAGRIVSKDPVSGIRLEAFRLDYD